MARRWEGTLSLTELVFEWELRSTREVQLEVSGMQGIVIRLLQVYKSFIVLEVELNLMRRRGSLVRSCESVRGPHKQGVRI
jgi:hypothetical protein